MKIFFPSVNRKRIRPLTDLKGRVFLVIALVYSSLPVLGQNCDVDFPGTAVRSFSTACGGSSCSNLVLGKSTYMGTGDIFTFDIPNINITGNISVNAQGGGKIVIPAGVTVNVAGNFQSDPKNSGCTTANPCIFEIEVNGVANFSQNFQNNLVNLVWSGTGTVVVGDDFQNTSNGCMECGTGGCPNFQVNSSNCSDDGPGCSGGNFCAQINTCSSDATDPIITGCPANLEINITEAGCTKAASWTPPTASDNCTLSSFIPSHSPGATFSKGIHIVTYTATDAAGNTATCSFNVNVVDNAPPVITGCPANITVSANASCQAVVNWTAPTFTDNCSGGTLSTTKSPGTTFNAGTTTVIYTATDDAGNTATCSFNVNVVDDAAPAISSCPANITVSANPSCIANVNWVPPSAVSNCSVVTMTSSHQPGYSFPIGITTVTYTATNSSGQASTCSFDVTVEDVTPPVLSGHGNVFETAGPSCNTKVNFSAPTIHDCGSVIVTSSHKPGDEFPVGSTEVTYRATDISGNSSLYKFNVIVEDKTGPVFQDCTADIIITVNSTCTGVANWAVPAVTDNCGGVTLTSSHNPGTTFPIGKTEVTYTATDTHGNLSVCMFNVIAKNESLPIISNCPNDVALTGNEANMASADWIIPTASAQCGEVTMIGSHQPGDFFTIGTTKIEYKATDDEGNTSYCSFNVIVSQMEIQIDIGKVVTPDGNGINDEWILTDIEKFKDNKVVVVDRWGSLIFIGTGYNNENVVWRGTNRNGGLLPTGTYFYTILVQFGSAKIEKSGFIELIR